MDTYKKLPDSELEVMMVVWNAPGPVNSAYIQAHLSGKREWRTTTLLTFLSRLVEKGFLRCERQGKINYYTPLIARQDYLENESRSMLERLYSGSFQTLVASLYNSRAITQQDLMQLRKFIDEKAGQQTKG